MTQQPPPPPQPQPPQPQRPQPQHPNQPCPPHQAQPQRGAQQPPPQHRPAPQPYPPRRPSPNPQQQHGVPKYAAPKYTAPKYAAGRPRPPEQLAGPQFPAPEFIGTREAPRPSNPVPPYGHQPGAPGQPSYGPPNSPQQHYSQQPYYPQQQPYSPPQSQYHQQFQYPQQQAYPPQGYPQQPYAYPQQPYPQFYPPAVPRKRRTTIITVAVVLTAILLAVALVAATQQSAWNSAPPFTPGTNPVTTGGENLTDYPDPAPVTTTPDNSWLTGQQAFPGMTITFPSEELDWGQCTVAFSGMRNGARVAFTAGHCDSDDNTARYTTGGEPFGSPEYSTDLFGNFIDYELNSLHDIALIELAPDVEFDARVGQNFNVTRVLRPDEIVVGMPVCKYGYRTERTCGEVTEVDGDQFSVSLFSLQGDSGSPAFVELGNEEVAALGVLNGSPLDANGDVNDYITYFTMIYPFTEEWDVTLTQ